MEGSAFKDPPWLLERDGQGFVQVTELLYRIAERCDGRRSVDQIAAEVADATGRGVSAENVRQLLGQQLLPKGLVQTADGRVVAGGGGDRSLLALNLRVKMAGSGIFTPAVNLLRVLYWPPLLLPALATVVVFQGWLYAVHGIAGGVREALYQPALLLVLLGATVLIAWFHELGHAAALRYGGGEVRAMGFGLYLVYPAFYTDVSDNYRLPRWSRVRTDLGGFYFNLLASLILGALYWTSGHEIFLLIVTVVNLDIIRQLMPFVRLDGYWVLADLTGIPDFFSHMGRFLRSLLPFKVGGGEKLPELTWWGKAVFLVYLLITLPLLLLLLFTTVAGLPRMFATAWDSFDRLGGSLSRAWSAGDAMAGTATAAQMALLALPLLGVAYSLFRIGRRGMGAAWTWSDRSAARRAIVFAGGVGLMAVLVYLWTPRLPLGDADAPVAGPASDWRPIAPEERGRIGDVPGAAVAVPLVTLPRGVATPAPTPSTPAAATTDQTVPSPQPASPTPSASPSPGSPSPSSSSRPASPAPSASPGTSASPGASARPAGGVTLRTTVAASLRDGPGPGFTVVGTLRPGEQVSATGRSADGAWYRVQAAAGVGWLSAGQVQIDSGTAASLPVVAAPPVASQPPLPASSPRPASRTPAASPAGPPSR
jgi:putative peptide zinc metalloprotease protein